MTSEERYPDGKLKASQQEASRAYRRRQARLRAWVDDLADLLGEKPDKLPDTPAADLIRRILQHPPTTT